MSRQKQGRKLSSWSLSLLARIRRQGEGSGVVFSGVVGGVDKHRLFCFCLMRDRSCLTSEAVQGAALSLQGVDYIEGSHSLPACMLGVCHCISDDVLKEHLQDASGLLVDES